MLIRCYNVLFLRVLFEQGELLKVQEDHVARLSFDVVCAVGVQWVLKKALDT